MVPLQGLDGGAPGPRWPGREDEKLDQALVAGLLLEVVLKTPGPGDPGARRTLIKARLKHTLASHLAGLVTLDRFRSLITGLDHWFRLYYPLVSRVTGLEAPAAAVPEAGAGPLPVTFPGRALRERLLDDWRRHHSGLLPSRPHRKLTWARLQDFLGTTRGNWFRVNDFARHLSLDRKTAWEYLKKLKTAGLLEHNQASSAAARYCLADRFLTVRAQALRRQVARELSDWPPRLAAQVAEALIATGGEPFWEEDWPLGPTPERRREILDRLSAGQFLELAAQSGPARMFRLASGWRQGEDGP